MANNTQLEKLVITLTGSHAGSLYVLGTLVALLSPEQKKVCLKVLGKTSTTLDLNEDLKPQALAVIESMTDLVKLETSATESASNSDMEDLKIRVQKITDLIDADAIERRLADDTDTM